jgi:hypothetical protein
MCPVESTGSYRSLNETSRAPLYPFIGIQVGTMTAVELGIQHLVKGGKIDLDIDKISYAEVYINNINVQLTDDILWSEGTIAHLTTGYANRPDRINRHGSFALSSPRFEFGGQQQRIILSGLGDGAPLAIQAKRRVFEGMTYDQIVIEIAKEYGYETNDITIPLRETIPSVTQAGMTDYAFLKELALRSGTDFFVRGNNLYFMIPSIKPTNQPHIVDAAGDGARSITFSIDGMGNSAEIISSPFNPMTGLFETVTSQFVPDNILHVKSSDQIDIEKLVRYKTIYVDGRGNLLSQGALQTMLDAEANRRKQVVRVRAVVDGMEQLAPRQFVMFLNVGSRFCGPYYVTHVVHEVRKQGSDYVTIFEGERTTTGKYRRTIPSSGSVSVGGTPTPYMDVSGSSEAEF